MKPLKLALPFAFAVLLAGCGGDDTRTGTIRLSLTDSPACGYDNVFVTVEKVRVHQSGGASDNDAGWSEVVLPTPQRVDLLTLTNGTLIPLGQTELPAGTYTQMRLVLGDKPPPGSPAGTLANSIKPTGGAETELTTPSGLQSGLKMNVNITVPAEQVVDFALDFDACKSFVKSGTSGKYILKPVISVIPIVSSAAQRVVGYVDPALAVGTTSVSLQQAGVPVKATVPGANGSFVLYPVPAGTYDLVVTATGRATAVMTGVPATTTSVTTVNALATAIAPPVVAQGTRDVTGNVTPATASVRALQSLNGGPTVDTHWAAVDAATGDFAFALPIDPPVRTTYVANPPAVTLTPDTLALGLYTVEARSGVDTKTQAIDTKAAVPPVTFAFP
ncbi:MAG TPA: DUF4382 domain-containing protein [Burkholderiaceae bacterium]|nr:DUF4382 domain-containing protein [Burkholderiaceae bacterium]